MGKDKTKNCFLQVTEKLRYVAYIGNGGADSGMTHTSRMNSLYSTSSSSLRDPVWKDRDNDN